MRIERFSPDSQRFADFRAFADELNAGDSRWSAPADPSSALSPLCLVALDNDRIVARACVTRIEGESALRLGWYECVDDQDAARILIDAALEHAREIGADRVIGPIDGTTWHRYRFADPSPNPPFFLDVHHKPYYAAQWIACGAEPFAEYFSTSFENLAPVERYDEHVAEQLVRHGVTLRGLRVDRFDEELRTLHAISVDAFVDNLLYTPIALDEFIELYTPLRPLLRPELVLIAEDAIGTPVGFTFAVDNLYERTRRSLIAKSLAVVPGHRGTGLGRLLLESIHQTASECAYDQIIHALMHRDNRSGRILSDRSAPYRTYRLYTFEVV